MLLKQAQHKTASNGNTGCGFFMLQQNAFHTYTVYKKMIIINIKRDIVTFLMNISSMVHAILKKKLYYMAL